MSNIILDGTLPGAGDDTRAIYELVLPGLLPPGPRTEPISFRERAFVRRPVQRPV
jgi:hypothetical protein